MPNQPSEKWKPVVGYEKVYAVSNRGRIKRTGRAPGATVGAIIKPWLDTHGYPSVSLNKNGSRQPRAIHILVAKAFLGKRPQDYQVNHIDGDKTNNRINNLEYTTHRGNAEHAKITGLIPRGEKSATAKLTREEVIEIRRLYDTDRATGSDLAALFDCSESHIYMLTSRKRWKHLP